jgi:SPP1 family predicted phage head-tail adaptor
MQAGKLRHKIVIQQASEGLPPTGAAVWSDFLTLKAGVEPLQGREYWEAKQLQNEVTTRFRIYYRPGIISKMRVLYAGKYYDIVSVTDPEEMHRELELLCIETSEGR